jgi:phosphoribosylformylglycinamidine synthase
MKALGNRAADIGRPISEQQITIKDGMVVYRNTRAQLEEWWSDTSYQLQKLRDNPEAADQEHATVSDDKDPGLSPKITYEPLAATYADKPKVAIFREEGVNGHVEMAAAFDKAGFTSVDVHLNDIASGRVKLDEFHGLTVGGGFSYGDVLGAGEGWAKSILMNDKLRQAFQQFFARPDTFSFGACNGCQMLAALKDIIPGAETWPTFLRNISEQFEARVVTVQINESPSILLKDMAGSHVLVPVAHGEGRAEFASSAQRRKAEQGKLIAMQYVDNHGHVTEQYPANPNGSPDGITSLTTPDGRATILMPHPERAFQTRQLSWHPSDWSENSPWFRIFQNARAWVEEHR